MYIAVNCNTATIPNDEQIRRKLIRYDYIQNSASYQADDYFYNIITNWQAQFNTDFDNELDDFNLDEAQNYAILNLSPAEITLFNACHPATTIHGEQPITPGQLSLF